MARTYREYIEKLRAEFIGQCVMYDGNVYTITIIDYNGIIHINKPSQHNETTAVYDVHEARKMIVGQN